MFNDHIHNIGIGTRSQPRVDCHPRLCAGEAKFIWIASYANEPSPEEGKPNCDLVLLGEDIRQILRRQSNWPTMDLSYALITNVDIVPGTILTTDYKWARSVVQKGYLSFMDHEKAVAKNVAEQHRPRCNINWADSFAKRASTISQKEASKKRRISNLKQFKK